MPTYGQTDRQRCLVLISTALRRHQKRSLPQKWQLFCGLRSKLNEKYPLKLRMVSQALCGSGWLSRYSDSLRTGRSGDRIPVGARFSAPVQTVLGAYPASCTMGTGSFPGVKRPGRGVDHPPPSKCRGLERVGLYLYSPSELSWTVIGGTYVRRFITDILLRTYNCNSWVNLWWTKLQDGRILSRDFSKIRPIIIPAMFHVLLSCRSDTFGHGYGLENFKSPFSFKSDTHRCSKLFG